MHTADVHTSLAGTAGGAAGPLEQDASNHASMTKQTILFTAQRLTRHLRSPADGTISVPAERTSMRVVIGADHAGYLMKQEIIAMLESRGMAVTDVGTDSTERTDYPDFAAAVARAVVSGQAERGIMVCGSGAGASIAANKITGARSAVVHDHYTAHQAVEHDDMNVLAIGARVIGPTTALEIVNAYLDARFTGEERHVRRLRKVVELDRNRG